MDRPRLSIVIATYNAAKTLERALASIMAQALPSWELLIRDGGSTDSTLSIIEAHQSAVAWWESAPDNGIYDAWNQAIAHAKGEYVCFLGADDALHASDTLHTLFSAVGEGTFDLVTSRGMLRDKHWQPTHCMGAPWSKAQLPRRIRLCHPGLLHHRSLFTRFGGFSTRYRIVADFEFLLRLPTSIRTLDVPLITVDIQDQGISRNSFWQRIREHREVHAASPRVGPAKAWLYWADKAWRRPIARALGLPH
jgi:glycosyltransferase involved in cell wall biosynthesis